MNELTRLLGTISSGDSRASAELLPLVYEELRKLAVRKMASERPEHTLQPTALVHEAWLRLVGNESESFSGRTHFFAAAAEAMRRILVESARRRNRLKRGGKLERVEFDEMEVASPLPDESLILLDEALDRLSTIDALAAEVVKFCFFVGLTQEQAAQELDVSVSTVERRWSFARAWLFREMEKCRDDAP